MPRERMKRYKGTHPTTNIGRKAVHDTGSAEMSGIARSVMEKAKASGLMNDKDSRITGRVSAALVEQAKRRTGIAENTQLIEFALANLALEDDFVAVFDRIDGAVDPEIKLGF